MHEPAIWNSALRGGAQRARRGHRLKAWVWLVLGTAVGVMSACGGAVRERAATGSGGSGADTTAGQSQGAVENNGGAGATSGRASAGAAMSVAGEGGGADGGANAHCGAASEPCCASGRNVGCDLGLGCDPADLHCKGPCDGGDPTACVDIVAGKDGDFGTPLKSSWFLTGCVQQTDHSHCINHTMCPNQGALAFEDKGLVILQTFPVGGVAGQNYKLTFTFNAVADPKEYQDGTRDQPNIVPGDLPRDSAIYDSFYRGGSPVPSTYAVWKMTVFDENGKEARHYYMNSFPLGQGYESNRTFLLSYTKSIVVIGGGKVSYLLQDSNCNVADNCGPGPQESAQCAPRNMPNEPADVMLPAQYLDPTTQMLVPTQDLSALNPTATQP